MMKWQEKLLDTHNILLKPSWLNKALPPSTFVMSKLLINVVYSTLCVKCLRCPIFGTGKCVWERGRGRGRKKMLAASGSQTKWKMEGVYLFWPNSNANCCSSCSLGVLHQDIILLKHPLLSWVFQLRTPSWNTQLTWDLRLITRSIWYNWRGVQILFQHWLYINVHQLTSVIKWSVCLY